MIFGILVNTNFISVKAIEIIFILSKLEFKICKMLSEFHIYFCRILSGFKL